MIKRIILKISPPPSWKIPVILVTAILCGLGLVVIKISNAPSYLSDNPEACMNCHVMASAYATWQRGSHGRVAVCNDCHVPQDFFRRYWFKAQDGLRHASVFTFRLEPQVIRIKSAGAHVVQENCRRCHESFLAMISERGVPGFASHDSDQKCWDCHRETPHGRVNGLWSSPYARVPRLSPAMPDWINDIIKDKPEKK